VLYVAGGAVMTGEPGLVGLLHRADWTRLSMSAQVSDGSTVLVAPGRRYRLQAGEYVTGCDGDRPWELYRDDDDADGSVHWVSGPEPPLRRLLCPAWLLESSRLEVRERVRACGRDALDVVVTRRPSIRGKTVSAGLWSGPVEAIVDAELGVLLRVAEIADGAEPDVTELVSVDFDPIIDLAQFTPPPGSLIAESFGEVFGAGGPIWWAAKTAAGLAAGGLGAWIRYSPFRHGQPEAAGAMGVEPAIPGEDPAPELSPQGLPSGPPVRDEVLHLLYQGGLGAFSATLHQWIDVGVMASQVPAAARRTGFGGLGLLLNAVSEQPAAAHLISALRIAGPGRYQIDHGYQPRRGPKTIACDGQRRWQVYGDKVTTGPAGPPPGDIGDLADPSWLLQCRLSGGAQVMAGDRPAYRINVARGHADWSFSLMFPAAVAVVDAELGIVLRLTSYIGAKPVRRYELQDITTSAGGFRVHIPADLPTVEETGPFDDVRQARPPHPASIPLNVASLLARQAAAEAAKATRNLLRRVDTREPHDHV